MWIKDDDDDGCAGEIEEERNVTATGKWTLLPSTSRRQRKVIWEGENKGVSLQRYPSE